MQRLTWINEVRIDSTLSSVETILLTRQSASDFHGIYNEMHKSTK